MSQEQSFSADQPIKNLWDDRLGREDFCRNLAKAISFYEKQDSLVIGLYGSWGSGKTSVINMTVEALKQEALKKKKKANQPLIVHFEPWYFSGQDHLLEQFFKHLSQEIKQLKKRGETINKNINSLSQLLSKGMDIVISVLKFTKPLKVIPGIGVPIQTINEISLGIKDFSDSIVSGTSKENKFNPIEKKEEISKKLEKLKIKILIIIDDIDRLTKDEMRQVFQLVKALANFPNTIYLLSFDEKIVTDALKDVQFGDGSQFLEKIIQVPFTIPDISRAELDKYLEGRIKDIIKFSIKSNSEWKDIYLSRRFNFYFENLREINRFINIFSFEYSLIGSEVYLIDLIILSAIKSQDNKLYNFIRSNQNMFCNTPPWHHSNYGFDTEQQFLENLKNRYDNQKENFRKIFIIESVLKYIFPRFNKILETEPTLFDINSRQTAYNPDRDRMASSPDYFDIYFRLSFPDDKIPRAEIQRIISLQDNPEQFAKEILQSYILEDKCQIFNELSLRINEFKTNNIKLLILAISHLGDRTNSGYDAYGVYYFIDNLINHLNNHPIEAENRSREILVKNLFDDNIEGLYIPTQILYDYATALKFYNINTNERNPQNIESSEYSNDFKAMEHFIDNRLLEMSKNDSLQKNPRLWFLLNTWNIIDCKSVNQYIQKLQSTPEGKIDLLKSCSYPGSPENPKIDFYLKKWLDKDEFFSQISKIRQDSIYFTNLPENSQLLIQTFLEQHQE